MAKGMGGEGGYVVYVCILTQYLSILYGWFFLENPRTDIPGIFCGFRGVVSVDNICCFPRSLF